MEEIWIDLKGVVDFGDNYEISNLTKVRNKLTGHVLAQTKGNNGYFSVGLSYNKRHKKYLLHRLLMIAFIPKPEGKDYN